MEFNCGCRGDDAFGGEHEDRHIRHRFWHLRGPRGGAAGRAGRGTAQGWNRCGPANTSCCPIRRRHRRPRRRCFPCCIRRRCSPYLAAVTERMKLGTGIVLIAQRNPVVLAKEMASLDVLSVRAADPRRRRRVSRTGVPRARHSVRGSRRANRRVHCRNARAVARRSPAFDGRFVGFAGIQSRPRPVQAGGPPIVVGGASDAAIERAVRVGQGWYGFAMDVGRRTRMYRTARRRAVALGPQPTNLANSKSASHRAAG